jgi:hypothetical protein
MSFLTILHVILVGAISSAIAYEIVRRRSVGLWIVLGYIAGLAAGILFSFVLAFFLYPSLGLVAQGEDFIFRTYALFRTASLMSVLFSGVAVAVAWTRPRKRSPG